MRRSEDLYKENYKTQLNNMKRHVKMKYLDMKTQ